MLEGIFGTENLAGLKEVYLRLNNKQGEIMGEKIVKEVKAAVRIIDDAKRPRMTLDH